MKTYFCSISVKIYKLPMPAVVIAAGIGSCYDDRFLQGKINASEEMSYLFFYVIRLLEVFRLSALH